MCFCIFMPLNKRIVFPCCFSSFSVTLGSCQLCVGIRKSKGGSAGFRVSSPEVLILYAKTAQLSGHVQLQTVNHFKSVSFPEH